jgi:hypothetical protein
MASWKDNFKFPMGAWFHFGTLAFSMGDNGKLELQAQKKEGQL